MINSLLSDSDEVPEGNKVSGRLVQRACGDPQEHLPQAVRAGVDQLQPQQPHQDIQIRLHTPVQHQVTVPHLYEIYLRIIIMTKYII